MRVLRVIPEARSASFDRTTERADSATIYVSRYSDLDPSSLWASAHQVPLAVAWSWAWRRRWDVVHLPEPLWLRALPLTLSVGLAVRLSDLVHRRRTAIVTYAMENNDPSALLHGLPGGADGAVFGMIRFLVNRLYDRMALASDAAGECYARLRLLVGRREIAQFEDLIPAWPAGQERPKAQRVAFVGVLEPRKGLPELLAAWESAGMGRLGWELAVAGSGPLGPELARAAEVDPSVVPLGLLNRREVHDLLAESSVVVLPSRREGRWKEQIGLPIVEGLAHGCRVVATADSGLSPWLRRHGHRVLPPVFTVADLADALRAAIGDGLGPSEIRRSLPEVDGRVVAESWMYRPAGAVSGQAPTG